MEVFYGLLFDGNITVESEGNSFEQTIKNPFLQGFKCDLCDFTAKSERVLKEHKSRKRWPCELCKLICKNQSDLKKHKMDEHTLKYSAEVLRGLIRLKFFMHLFALYCNKII